MHDADDGSLRGARARYRYYIMYYYILVDGI
jgi:hypothetical protein